MDIYEFVKPEKMLEKVVEFIPSDAKKTFEKLIKDGNESALLEWIQNKLKPGLIKVHNSFGEQLLDNDNHFETIEISSIIRAQEDILTCLGMIEVFLSLKSSPASE